MEVCTDLGIVMIRVSFQGQYLQAPQKLFYASRKPGRALLHRTIAELTGNDDARTYDALTNCANSAGDDPTRIPDQIREAVGVQ
jgi:hypothetical protein